MSRCLSPPSGPGPLLRTQPLTGIIPFLLSPFRHALTSVIFPAPIWAKFMNSRPPHPCPWSVGPQGFPAAHLSLALLQVFLRPSGFGVQMFSIRGCRELGDCWGRGWDGGESWPLGHLEWVSSRCQNNQANPPSCDPALQSPLSEPEFCGRLVDPHGAFEYEGGQEGRAGAIDTRGHSL